MGILITCSCSTTLIDSASFANPDSDYYSGPLVDATTITVNVKGSAKTATLLIDNLLDTVSFMCGEDYNVSCGEKAPFIMNLKTGNVVDLTGSHNLLTLSGAVLTIKADDEALIGSHTFRVQAYMVDHESLGYFEPFTDLTIEVEAEIIVEEESACSGSTVVQDDKKSRYDYVIGSGSTKFFLGSAAFDPSFCRLPLLSKSLTILNADELKL